MNSDFGAADAAAAEEPDPACLELYDAVFGGVNREVAAHEGADTGTLGHADLAYDNLAGLNFLSAEKLNSEALARAVVDVLGCTAGFDV